MGGRGNDAIAMYGPLLVFDGPTFIQQKKNRRLQSVEPSANAGDADSVEVDARCRLSGETVIRARLVYVLFLCLKTHVV